MDTPSQADHPVEPDAGSVVDELDQPRPAPPAHEPGRDTGATAAERASAQAAAELSDR